MSYITRFLVSVLSLIIPFYNRKKISYKYAMRNPGRLGIGVHLVHAFLAAFVFILFLGVIKWTMGNTTLIDKMWVLVPLYCVDHFRTNVLIERVLDSPYDSMCKERGIKNGRY